MNNFFYAPGFFGDPKFSFKIQTNNQLRDFSIKMKNHIFEKELEAFKEDSFVVMKNRGGSGVSTSSLLWDLPKYTDIYDFQPYVSFLRDRS